MTSPSYLVFSKARFSKVILCFHGHRTLAMSQGTKAQNLYSIKIQCWQHSHGQRPTGLAHYMICLCHEMGLVWLSSSVHTCSTVFEFLYHHIQYNEYTWLSVLFVLSFWLFHRNRISWTTCMINFRTHTVSYISPPSSLILLTFYTYCHIIAGIYMLFLYPFQLPVSLSLSFFLPLKVICIEKLHP